MTRSRGSAASVANRRRAMTVAGIMSGTSADGIDVALVRILPARETAAPEVPRLKLLAHLAVPYSTAVRERVLRVMNGKNESVAELSQLHWRLGQLYAEAVEAALEKHPVRLDLVGCHGQTIYHQSAAAPFLRGQVACTWQMGESSVIAARLGVPVVSDFRTADLAAGGQGAPLVPLLDFVAFHHPTRNRVLQNLGGIGNLTVIPANGKSSDVFAFDTGPANMVIDAIMASCFGKPYDAAGAVAARGRVLDPVLRQFLSRRFFSMQPPKSAGREQFGQEFVEVFRAACRKHSPRCEDAVATATALTARSIALAWGRFVQPSIAPAATDYAVAGGGAKNLTLMKMIAEQLAPFGEIEIRTTDEFGIPVAAKEAMAFALLAYQAWHGLPGNLPRATGAERAVILGKIAYA